MSPGYVPTGPWTAGSAPGVSAAFLTNLEAFVQQLEGDTGVTTITGGTNGTADCYQPLQGTINMDVITALAAGGGTAVNQGNVQAHSFGGITHPFDTIRFDSGAGSNHNSTIIVIGV